MMSSSLPLELYNEFISYLWDDKKSLIACSLASRTLTIASQKLLFYQIILHAAPGGDKAANPIDFGGTSSALNKLLEKSPHIAEYVQCLQIFDIDESNGDDSDSSSDSSGDWPEDSWLPEDTFLPIFSPLFCNLKAFVLFYVPNWDLLCDPVRRSLQDLIRLPSLVYVDMAPRPTVLLKDTFGDNLKHLVIREDDRCLGTLISSEPSECSPIYLETLFMAKAEATLLTPLTSDPNFRFKTSQLRRLVLDIKTDKIFQHAALWPLLRSCRETLEHFTFMPCIETLTMTDVGAPQSTSIDLSQMTALKTLTLYFDISRRSNGGWNPLWCFNNIVRSPSSTCQKLEEITVIMELYGRRFTDLRYWNETCDILLDPKRFPRLTRLSIHTLDSDHVGAPAFSTFLGDSESMTKLRARPGIEVVTRVIDHVNLWTFAPDKRWGNVAFDRI